MPTEPGWAERVCDLIAQRYTVSAACEIVGVSTTLFYKHLKDDRQLQERYAAARARQADWVRGRYWEIAENDEHRNVFQALERLGKAHVPEFRETVEGVDPPDRDNAIAEAIERFTAAVVQLASRSRAELPAGNDS